MTTDAEAAVGIYPQHICYYVRLSNDISAACLHHEDWELLCCLPVVPHCHPALVMGAQCSGVHNEHIYCALPQPLLFAERSNCGSDDAEQQ
jgi:hypothetical protein